MSKDLPQPRSMSPQSWVQIPRATLEEWGALIVRSPVAARLLMLLASRVGTHNAIVVSQPTLAALAGVHPNTVAKATKLLAAERWLEIRRVSGSGSTNAYVLNDRVVWNGPRDGLRYSLFSATVITSSAEQPDTEALGNQAPLRRLPRADEMQIANGPGLPPPSQPFFDGMEPDLPSTSNEPSN
jgi:DNA-binding transcriptional regulator YdaS (Cro superfamily)